jgi:putative ABC transport system substrate-binding protein
MRRREFLGVLGGAVGWPFAAHAQQQPMPVIGWLGSEHAEQELVAGFTRGLSEAGFTVGPNVAIEYRWAEGQNNRLRALAAELVDRQVTLIVAPGSTPAALAAKAATGTIPVVFGIGSDPVQLGLVASLNRPGGNVTGGTFLGVELEAKRLELLHELVPTASTVALLVNPSSPVLAEMSTKEIREAGRRLGLEVHVLHASTEHDLDSAFAELTKLRLGALVIGGDAFFTRQRKQLGALSVRHAVPTIYQQHEFAAAGGLMSYGASLPDIFHLCGVYAGRILNGEKPADLPVQRSTKVELIVNLKTAKALGISVPLPLLGRADQIIE